MIPTHHPSASAPLTTLHFSQMIPPPSPGLEMNVLGESGQLTDITSMAELSFGDLAASASSRNRGGALYGIGFMGERHTRGMEERSGEAR